MNSRLLVLTFTTYLPRADAKITDAQSENSRSVVVARLQRSQVASDYARRVALSPQNAGDSIPKPQDYVWNETKDVTDVFVNKCFAQLTPCSHLSNLSILFLELHPPASSAVLEENGEREGNS